jgi:hypothetical protein
MAARKMISQQGSLRGIAIQTRKLRNLEGRKGNQT